ncbi:uncharacterized protein F5147DRAFT_658149 [Suillus discolor]|uniref:Uncharacterized protein n=1 Tax=Suillus discolor TaxID=1912936 RepID=A0A9P7JMH0_9AGAM|nr:uncharacterized protein F5147DRAFT_658149 [Suillus discolor]KAG2090480.1 hypothetical protein F5147DRAFT_658149 [Suillus discolor]
MAFPTSDPIALEIKPRSEDDINHILCTFPIIKQSDNKKILFMSDADESVTILEKCIDCVDVLAHQLLMYCEIASILLKLPESAINARQSRFYLSLASYMSNVLNAFIGEVKQEGPKGITSKWCSAHLDFHIALTLHDSAFTVAHQKIALKKMNWTWAQFKEKKALCIDGEDMCGGLFLHTKSTEDMIDTLLASMGKPRIKPSDPKNNEEAASKNGSEQKYVERGTLKLDLESDHESLNVEVKDKGKVRREVAAHMALPDINKDKLDSSSAIESFTDKSDVPAKKTQKHDIIVTNVG